MKIVADKDIPLVDYLFSRIGEVVLVDGRSIDHDLVQNTDVLIVRTLTRITGDLLRDSKVRIVASATSGVDHVDLDLLRKQGIEFIHAPGANARPVAEYVLSALCVLACQDGFDLQEKRVGIIGCGNTGGCVLHLLQSVGVECLVNDPPLRDKTGAGDYRDLNELFSADIITLHVPLVNGGKYPTGNLVDGAFLSGLKPDVILINTSRGEVVDETALLSFLEGNPGARAVLDVWCNEPRIQGTLLNKATIGTPHIAGYSLEGKIRATELVFRQVCKSLDIEGSLESLQYPGFNNFKTGITFTEIDDQNELLRLAILAGYDVRSDSASLRRMLALEDTERSGYFDDLRKSSMLRREFSAVTVKLPPGYPNLKEQLSVLGFEVI